MKKFFLIVLTLVSFLSYGQFPSNPTSGNINWNSHNVGAITGDRGIAAGVQVDTAAWNAIPWVKTVPYIIVNTSNDGFTWRRNSSATKWEKIASGTSVGTVTSVGLALPSIFTVSGSPVTTSGTLTGTLATQSANLVFAGPTTGVAATPTFRNLVAGDLPSLSTLAWSLTGNAGTVAGTNFLGTTDAVNLQLRTGGSKRFTINTNGAFGLGTGEDYGVVNQALLSNGISTAPTWKNIQDGWYNIVRDGGADTTGATDVSTIIQNAITSGWRNIFIPKGTFLISTQVQLNDSTTIMGAGRFASIIKLTSNIAAFRCSFSSGGNAATFSNIGFYGSYASGATTSQKGIFIDSAQAILVTMISGNNIGGDVVEILQNGNCCADYITRSGKSNTVTESYFIANYGGVNFNTRAEYNLVSNCTFTQNLYAIRNAGGNNRIEGNTATKNTWGLYMVAGSNGGHGVATGNTFNHNRIAGVGANLYISGVTLGFTFVNCTFGESGSATAGLLEILSSNDIDFQNTLIWRDTVRMTANSRISFTNNYGPSVFGFTPVWNIVSGEAPTVVKVGKVLNSITLQDVANTKQFDITHTNGLINFTGTAGNKFGFNNAAPSEVVDITGNVRFSGALMPNNDAGTSSKILIGGTPPTWSSSLPSSLVPAWQTTLTAGSTLTGNNTIAGGGFDFTWNNIDAFQLNATDDISLTTTNSGRLWLVQSTNGNANMQAQNANNAHNSFMYVYTDSITVKPNEGNLNIDTLNNLSAQNTLMGWVSTADANRGKVGYITLGSGGSINSGVLNFTGTGVSSLSAIGSSPNANGGTITGSTLNLEPASASFGGVVTTGAQTFAGAKTVTSDLSFTAAKAIFNPSSASEWMRVNVPTAYTGAAPYQTYIYNAINGDGTYNNPVVSGFNQYRSFDATRSGNYTSMENNYRPASSKYMEYHYEVALPVNATNPSGEISRLFSSTFIQGDSLSNSTNQWDFRGNSFYITDLKSTSPYIGFTGSRTTGAWTSTLRSPNVVSGVLFQGTGSDAVTYMDGIGATPTLISRNWGLFQYSGHLEPTTTGASDLGFNNRWRSLRLSSWAEIGASDYYAWQGRSLLTSPSDGIIQLNNNASSGFTRLNYGGTTSSFPAIARNGTGIDIKLADNSAYTGLTALTLTGNTSVTSPLLIGGTAVGSNVTYKSTTAVGTANATAHQFTGGNNGATTIMNMWNSGEIGVNATPILNQQFTIQASGVNRDVLRLHNASGICIAEYFVDGSGNGEMYVRNSAATTQVLITGNGGDSYFENDLGVGTSTATARLQVVKTTEQLRVGYDASNYVSNTVSSAGNLTISPTGTEIKIATAKALNFASGTNTRAGNATLVAGIVTVSNTTVTANTIVILTRKTSGGTPGTSVTYTLSAGTSFTITSDNALDTSTFSYILIENS